MKRYKLFIFCLLSSVLSIAQNQATIDSLLQILKTDISDRRKVDLYVEIAENYRGLDFEKVNLYSNKALMLAKERNYTGGTINALFNIGVSALNREKNVEADLVFTKMLDLADRNNDHIARVKAYRGLGKANRAMDKRGLALEYFFESLKISQKWGMNNEQAFNYNAIGLIYYQQGNNNKALEYYRASLNLFEQLDNKKGISITYLNLGALHKENENFEKAIDFFNRSIKIEKVLNRKIKISHGYFNLGQTYYQIRDYEKALEYYFESLKTHPKQIGKDHVMAETYGNMASVYVKLKDYKKALEYNFKSLKIYEDTALDAKKPCILFAIGQVYNIQNQMGLARKYTNQGLVLAQQQGLLQDTHDGAKQLALIEKKAKNYKKAYEANALKIQMTDSLYNEELIRKIANLEARYEFKKEKDSLQLLMQREIILNKANIKQRETRSLILSVIIGFFLIIGIVCFIIVYKAVQRKKIRFLRNRISRDLHDEIGSTLSSIALYGTVASSSVIKNPKKTTELLKIINDYSSSTIASMNDIVWAINSDEDSIRHLINRMRSFASELEDTGEWSIDINYEPKTLDRPLNMIQRRNIYLIFKETLNNAIKHSNGKEISVEIGIEKDLMKLDIIDDGSGFEQGKVIEKEISFGGNGLKNMRKRAEELGGKLVINSILNRGTNVSLKFNMNTKI